MSREDNGRLWELSILNNMMSVLEANQSGFIELQDFSDTSMFYIL